MKKPGWILILYLVETDPPDFKKFNYNHSKAAMILPLRLFYFKFVPQLQADLFIVRPVSW